MQVTAVRVSPQIDPPPRNDRYLGSAEVEFDDCLVVREIQLIQADGRRFAAMPNRELSSVPCPACRCRQRWRAVFCDQCGVALPAPPPTDRRLDFADLVFPTNQRTRFEIERSIWAKYRQTLERRLTHASAP